MKILIQVIGSTINLLYEIIDSNTGSSKLYYDNVLSSRTFGFGNTKTNKTQMGYSYYCNMPCLFSKGSKSMRSEVKEFNPSGAVTFHVQYSYYLDAAGYPAKQIICRLPAKPFYRS